MKMKTSSGTNIEATASPREVVETSQTPIKVELYEDNIETAQLFDRTVRDAIQEVRSKVADEIVTTDGPVLGERMTREKAEVSIGGVDIRYNATPSTSLNDPGARVRIVSGTDILVFGHADDYNYGYRGNWAQLSQRDSEGQEVLVWKVDLQGPYSDKASLRVTGSDKLALADDESAIKQVEEATLAIDDMLQRLG